MRLTAVLRTKSDKGGDGGQGGGDRGGSEGGHSGTGHHRAGWYIEGLYVSTRTGGFICKVIIRATRGER